MNYPLTLLAAVCGITIASMNSANASQTDLASVGTTVESVNQLLQQTVNNKTKSSGLKAPKITTSYLLGQGLTIAIAPIHFDKNSKRLGSQTVFNQPDAQSSTHAQIQAQTQVQDSTIAANKRTAHRKKARELAHAAHSLREQGKSLRRSIAEGNSVEKAKLTQTLDQIRLRQRSLETQRKNHAKSMPGAMQALAGPQNTSKTAMSYRQQFYQQLEQDVAQTLCHKATVLSSIDDKEKVSIVYQQGGDKADNTDNKGPASFNVRGWIVDKALLSRCAKGEIDQQYLARHVTSYQY